MKTHIKTCVWTVGILIAAVCLGTILMILAYLLPVDAMRQNAIEDLYLQLEEGDYYHWIIKDFTSTSDNFTDALMINTATYDCERSVIEKALLNPRAGYEEGSQALKLQDSLMGVEIDREITYGRYWHGYLVILKPLLLLFNYHSIRWINTVVGCALIAVILLGFAERFKNYKYAFSFLAAVLFLNPIVMRVSLQYNTVFYVIMAEYIIALYWGDRLEQKGRFKYIFLISGISVAFFDLLTYPIAALGMLLILQLLLFEDTLKNNIIRAVKGGVLWVVGYLGMWSGKWIVASLFTDENIIADAVNRVIYRTGTGTGINGVELSWRVLFEKNFLWLHAQNAILFKMAVLVIIAAIVVMLIRKKATIKLNPAFIITMTLFCFIPIARYAVMSNHSFIHSFFTYRECMVMVMAIMCILFNSVEIRKDTGALLV